MSIRSTMTDHPQLLESNINPTLIVCFAHICLSLETNPKWLLAIQAKSNVDTAGSQEPFAWGLCSLPVPELPESLTLAS